MQNRIPALDDAPTAFQALIPSNADSGLFERFGAIACDRYHCLQSLMEVVACIVVSSRER
jgi:hypothetical protein